MAAAPDLHEALEAFQRGDLDRARALAEKAFAVDPSPPWRHLLGLIHCRLGNPGEGVDHLRAAADADPANAAFKVMLARALVDSGRGAEVLAMPEPPPVTSPAGLALWQARAEAADAAADHDCAIDSWRAVVGAKPSDWRSWNNLGNACAAAEQWDFAVEALRKAAALNPREPAVRLNLAAALTRAGLVEEATRQLSVAASLEPGDAETWIALARLLAELGRHEEALDAWDSAARLAPDRTEVAIGRGRALSAIPRFEESEAAYRTALAIDPANTAAARELGLILERTGQVDELSVLLSSAPAAGIELGRLAYLRAVVALRDGRPEDARSLLLAADPGSDPARWHRLMARIADSLGDARAAFDSAVAMNRAVADFDEWRRRGAAYRAHLRSLGAAMTPDWAARLRPLDPPSRRSPAFLVGFPRSGTTLLDTFLMGHSRIHVIEEQPMLDSAEKVTGAQAAVATATSERMEQARMAYFAELDRHVDPGFSGIVLDKLPLNIVGMPLIHCLFPGAPVIFAQRHPCDAVLSGFMQSFVINGAMACFLDIEDAADLYDAAMSVWWRSRELLPLDAHAIVYEELVRDPPAALKPVIGHLRLEWEEGLLAHRRTAETRGPILTPSYDQVTEPVTSRPSGRWKKYRDQLAPVLPVLLPWAERLGYSD